jgi:hypothetical protein
MSESSRFDNNNKRTASSAAQQTVINPNILHVNGRPCEWRAVKLVVATVLATASLKAPVSTCRPNRLVIGCVCLWLSGNLDG